MSYAVERMLFVAVGLVVATGLLLPMIRFSQYMFTDEYHLDSERTEDVADDLGMMLMGLETHAYMETRQIWRDEGVPCVVREVEIASSQVYRNYSLSVSEIKGKNYLLVSSLSGDGFQTVETNTMNDEVDNSSSIVLQVSQYASFKLESDRIWSGTYYLTAIFEFFPNLSPNSTLENIPDDIIAVTLHISKTEPDQ